MESKVPIGIKHGKGGVQDSMIRRRNGDTDENRWEFTRI